MRILTFLEKPTQTPYLPPRHNTHKPQNPEPFPLISFEHLIYITGSLAFPSSRIFVTATPIPPISNETSHHLSKRNIHLFLCFTPSHHAYALYEAAGYVQTVFNQSVTCTETGSLTACMRESRKFISSFPAYSIHSIASTRFGIRKTEDRLRIASPYVQISLSSGSSVVDIKLHFTYPIHAALCNETLRFSQSPS